MFTSTHIKSWPTLSMGGFPRHCLASKLLLADSSAVIPLSPWIEHKSWPCLADSNDVLPPGQNKKLPDLNHNRKLFWVAMRYHSLDIMYQLKILLLNWCLSTNWPEKTYLIKLFITRWNTKKSMKRNEESPCWTLKHRHTSLPKSLSRCRVG